MALHNEVFAFLLPHPHPTEIFSKTMFQLSQTLSSIDMFRDNSLLCISIWRIRSAHTVEEEHSQHIHVSCLFKSQLPLIRKKYIYLYHKIYCLDSSSALMEETLVHKMRTTMWEACDRVVYVTGTVLWPFKTPISIPVEFITTPGITSCWLPLHSLKWEQIYGQIWLMHGWGGRGWGGNLTVSKWWRV